MRAIQFPFRLISNGRIQETKEYSQIVRGQVIDALMTNFGERVYRPRYGCDIQAAVFDPQDELVRNDAAAQIKSRLEHLVPRAIVRSVTLTPHEPEISAITITVVYRPSLYATDTTVSVPVASEFFRRQSRIPIAGGDDVV